MDDFDGLIDRLYESAADLDHWSSTLEAISDRLGGCGLVLRILPADTPLVFMAGIRIEPARLSQALENFATPASNPFIAAIPRLPLAVAIAREAIISDADYRRCALYDQFFRLLGLTHSACACLLRTPALVVPLDILRETRDTRPHRHDLRRLNRLLPHMRRSIQLFLRLDALKTRLRGLEAVADQLTCGVLLVNRKARILHANHAAEDMMNVADSVKAHRGTLMAAIASETQTLHHLIEQVTARRRPPDDMENGVALHRLPPRRPLWVTVLPIPEQPGTTFTRFSEPRAEALVTIHDPEKTPEPSEDSLRRLYRLTPAEVRLARDFCNGWGLEEYAARSGISIETARWRLKQIFAKTDTHRQVQLACLLIASGLSR